MISKEEILKPYLWDSDQTSDIVNDYDAEKAMDEYAKQVAIDFAKWLNNKNYQMVGDGVSDDWVFDRETKTTEELFHIYITSEMPPHDNL